MSTPPPQRYRAVIVDDEPLAREIVRDYVTDHPELAIVAECANGFEAIKAITELKPDILFLDIQMPKLNGFEVLKWIDHVCAVVFTTAYDEFAVNAFEVHAVDSLLKPFSRERFDRAVQRAQQSIGVPQQDLRNVLIASSRRAAIPLERILFRDGVCVHILSTHSIDFIQAQDDYVAIVSKGQRYLKHITLSALEQQLDPARFMRIHRSYLVNIERVAKIEPYAKDSRVAILADGTRLPVSRSGYSQLRQFF